VTKVGRATVPALGGRHGGRPFDIHLSSVLNFLSPVPCSLTPDTRNLKPIITTLQLTQWAGLR